MCEFIKMLLLLK